MGSDNLHHKRKERSVASFEREQGKRAQYDVVLIICEDSKTAPHYFKGLCEHLGLRSANIKILGCPSGTDAMSIVQAALDRYNQYRDYDRVFCVLDKEHANYQQALDLVDRERSKGVPIQAVPSVPCFEYWLLLHFKESSKPYALKGKKTPADQLKSEVKKCLGEYNPSDKKLFKKTSAGLEAAIERSKRITKIQLKDGTDNPSTRVHELVEYLISLKESV